jgi:hypothetical protein
MALLLRKRREWMWGWASSHLYHAAVPQGEQEYPVFFPITLNTKDGMKKKGSSST